MRIGPAPRFLLLTAAILFAAPEGVPQHSPPATADGARSAMTADSRKADLAAFRDLFMAKDKSFSEAARAEAEARIAKLEANVAGVSQAYFDLEVARIVALADNGHTHYVLGSISRYYNRAPIRLAVFGEDFYVVRATTPNADLLGARLTAIDGHPVADLRAAERSLWGGVDAFRDRYGLILLESPELLNALGLAKAPASAAYAFETKSGVVTRSIAGDPASQTRPYASPAQTLFPPRLPMEDDTWTAALTAEKAPWALQDWGKSFRWRAEPALKAVVLDMRTNTDAADQKIADALKMFEDAIASEKPANLILDMRFNGGGNLNTTRAFMKSLPENIPGRIFVLTSPLSFSAAISSVGYLKQFGAGKVSIVGEAVGDRMMFWAEGRGADLPNNRGMIGMATQRHDYAGGCKAYTDCHGSVKIWPIAVPTLAPDIDAPWTIEAYLAGRDPAMEAVAEALRQP